MMIKSTLAALPFFLLQASWASAPAAEPIPAAETPAAETPAAETPAGWYRSGEQAIAQRRERSDSGQARNVILFVGDGMSLTTITAARLLAGQQAGESGESHRLSFESFPNIALAKTYNTNQQTPDSAGTMTAMVTGVKSYAGAIAVDQRSTRANCDSVAGHELVSIVDLAKASGLSAGIVTTARITHATPAAAYAKAPERGWEDDSGLAPAAAQAGCRDIARQLVDYDIGGGLDVVFGGGRSSFMPAETFDPEYGDQPGRRRDRTNLIDAWLKADPSRVFVWNQSMFDKLPADAPGNVLGLFEQSHMQYEHDRAGDSAGEPSLAEMTIKALDILQRRESDGYLLIVEGARIDHAHHAGNAYRSLTDTIALSDAIAATMARIDPAETLVIVTADHSHALTFGGYAERGNPILGLVRGPGRDGGSSKLSLDSEGKPYTSLNYINGPGFRSGPRPDYDDIDPEHPDFRQEAIAGLSASTHSGEDVAVYAIGPGADTLHGSIEQHLIFHAMIQAQPALARKAEQIKGGDGLPQWRRLQQLLQASAEPEPVEAVR
ncbi:MAG: alkaline phosphatase [Wenzhouxiangellaceae bacterium]|nr:alkaline phosphatase [Wenzhouxiangellaceae bacterium]